MRLQGRVVVVTGASSGIGEATALAAARRGARAVVLIARSAGLLEDVARRVRTAGAAAHPVVADLGDEEAAARAAREAEAAAGPPDVLVNNAGAGRWWFLEETPPGGAREALGAPYLAAFHVTRALLPGMLARRAGTIVNVTSPAAFAPWPGAAAYAAARWAVRGLDEALGAELRGTGVRTLLYCPGEVRSGYWAHNPGAEERLPGIAPWLGRLTPEQAAAGLLAAVERGARRAVVPWRLAVALQAARLFPGAVGWLVAATGARRPPPR
ncbi:MAG: SDR family NAD(P)-dependent oxidoreductase [Anaeromyxobacteraceae bacterium]